VKSRVVYILLFAVQFACAFFFLYEIFVNLLGLRAAPISWRLYEFIEIGAALGLVIGRQRADPGAQDAAQERALARILVGVGAAQMGRVGTGRHRQKRRRRQYQDGSGCSDHVLASNARFVPYSRAHAYDMQ